MENFFKNVSPLNLIMAILAITSTVGFALSGNWVASIWAFNTLLWVGVESVDRKTINELRDKVSELLEEKYRKNKEENR